MVRIGHSELHVFPLSLGGNVFGWTADEVTSFAVLDAYAAAGGNFIDTADAYGGWVPGSPVGASESIIGRWMKARANRKQMVVATKVAKLQSRPGLGAANIRAALSDSLSRLGTEVIDLYFAHHDDASTPLEESLGTFDALVKEGTIRSYGLSNYSPERIEACLRVAEANGWAKPVALQPHYSLVHREEYERGAAPVVERAGMSTVPYFALASGFLTGKYPRGTEPSGLRAKMVKRYLTESGFALLDTLGAVAQEQGQSMATVALAWLLAKPTVLAPIASASKPAQVADLVAAPQVTLTADQLERLDRASAAMEPSPAV